MPADPPWFLSTWAGVLDRPQLVDEALDREDEYAGVALLALVLGHPDPAVAPPRIRRALAARNPQTRANALQSLGHQARLHGVVDAASILALRRALRDDTVVGRGPYRIRGYAETAADDIGSFARRRELPRWFRRRFPEPVLQIEKRAGGPGPDGGGDPPGQQPG
ncbi:hypothetical protein Asp14428_56630 [Actinoplanes sp. NBRC 14428]|nr:hypothetical protein Asp14428_56630 [Actinoplanes sp. NBRC 14428]